MCEVFKMSKIIFTPFQMNELENNPNVIKVSDRSITYAPEFQIKAVKENKAGKGPTQIFLEAGFKLEVVGRRKPKQCLDRWRKIYDQYNEDGFLTERRGKGSIGRPSTKDLTPQDQLKKAQARIAYLEAELELVKKLDELERQAMERKRR